MSTALMAARRKKDNRAGAAIAKAIMGEYQPQSTEEMQDALKDIFGPMFEAMLQGEMDSHLGYESNNHGPKKTTNRRNGYINKNLKTTLGEVAVAVPRDRDVSFESSVIPKRTRDVSGIEDKVLSMYAKGIHCIWYCVNTASNRVEPEEIEWLKELSKDNKITQVPIIIVLTQSFSKGKADEMR